MYTIDDIAQSLRRCVADLLPDGWVVDLERVEVRDDQRPAALIEVGAARMRQGRVSPQQGDIERFAPFTTILYPSISKVTVAGREARRLQDLIHRWAMNGVPSILFEDGRRASGPERVPLYDYADVDTEDPEAVDPEFPHDTVWLEDYSANAIQDDLEPERWTVVLDGRISWWAPGTFWYSGVPADPEEPDTQPEPPIVEQLGPATFQP